MPAPGPASPLGCSTFTFRALPAGEALRTIAAEGVRTIDLCIIPGACPHFDLAADDPTHLSRLRALLAETHLAVASLNVIVGFLNQRNAPEVARLMERAVGLASEIGASLVTFPSGVRVDPRAWDESARMVRERLLPIAESASRRGVAVTVEAPHKGTLCATLDEAARLFDLLGPGVGCTLDTSHIIAGGEPSLTKGLGAVGVSRVRHVHLRDALGMNIQVTPGRGRGDFAGFFAALERGGYGGAMTLELELRRPEPGRMLREFRFARAHLERLRRGEPAPLRERVERLAPVALARRALMNPVEEIKRSEWLKHAVISAAAHARSLTPTPAYEGSWRRRVSFPLVKTSAGRGTRALMRAQEKPVRVCVAGSGYAGGMHAFGFRRLAGVEVVGVSDLDGAKSGRLARRVGCRAYVSTFEMIETEKPDVVAVTTGEWQHYDIVRHAFRQGAAVYCEKIMTPSVAEAEELTALARERGLAFGMSYNYRFMPNVRRLRTIIASGEAGAMTLAAIRVHGAAHHHVLDLVSHLGGEIAAVSASFVNDDAMRPFGTLDWRVWDPEILYVPSRALALTLEMRSGARVAVTSSFLHDPRAFIMAMDVTLERGSLALTGIRLDDIRGRLSWSGPGRMPPAALPDDTPRLARGYDYSFYKAAEAFMNAYLGAAPMETSGEDGLRLLRLERAITRSNATGRRIEIGAGGAG